MQHSRWDLTKAEQSPAQPAAHGHHHQHSSLPTNQGWFSPHFDHSHKKIQAWSHPPQQHSNETTPGSPLGSSGHCLTLHHCTSTKPGQPGMWGGHLGDEDGQREPSWCHGLSPLRGSDSHPKWCQTPHKVPAAPHGQDHTQRSCQPLPNKAESDLQLLPPSFLPSLPTPCCLSSQTKAQLLHLL